MCGICGAWSSNQPDLQGALRASLDALRHRGPDGEGQFIDGGSAVAMRRLSILDIEGGQQPIWNETGDMCVVLNGEIYNYIELAEGLRSRGHELRTQSDTESVIHLYEEDHLGFAKQLRGMFALAILDRRNQRLVLARDRFGKKPLYYRLTPSHGLLFASELGGLIPLIRSEGLAIEIDPQAIYDYLSLGSVPQPGTVYKHVKSVPPGHMLIVDPKGCRPHEYWRPKFAPQFGGSYEDAKQSVRAKIEEAVRLRLRSDVPIGAFLSGGVDSSIVTYEAAKAVGGELRTFTVASSDPELDESPVAERTAKRLGVRNTVLHLEIEPERDLNFLVSAYGQPFADPSAIPSLAVSRAAREHVKVILNGDGGDELFAGYRRHVAVRSTERLAWVPRPVAAGLSRLIAPERRSRRSALGLAGRMLRGLGLSDEQRYLVWTSDMLLDADKARAWRSAARSTESIVRESMDTQLVGLDRQISTELRLNLLSSLLVKMDIATSAFSLEGRSPLLDHEVGELALRLPDDFRIRNGRPKAILRDAYAQELGAEVVGGKKRGFEVPLAAWLDGSWRSLLRDTVGARDARVLSFLDGRLVNNVLDPVSFADRNKAYITYSFLVLELWLRSIEV